MCGIFGVVDGSGSGVEAHRVAACLRLLKHRGPDDEGYVAIQASSGGAAEFGGNDTTRGLTLPHINGASGRYDVLLAHRRLSILDLSAAGHQPMPDESGDYWIVFNGEIYNYIELRTELRALGHVFRSGTDTEVILAAYKEWGESALLQFEGMFALAIYQKQTRQLFLARDPLGIKPLYFVANLQQLAFASEIRPLLEWRAAANRVQPQKLYEYLIFGVTDGGEETLIEGISEVPGGGSLTLTVDRPDHPVRRQYWTIDIGRRTQTSFEHAAFDVRRKLENSVRLHLRSDVPLGACLSGGLDSTAIVTFMAKAIRGRQDIHSFTYVAQDDLLGEAAFAELARKQAGLLGHEVTPGPADFGRDFDELIVAQELPFRSTSIYAQYRVFGLAAQHGIKVMLDGQGSDEIFGGYNSFIASRAAGLFTTGQWLRCYGVLRSGKKEVRPHDYGRLLLQTANKIVPSGLNPALRAIAGQRESAALLNHQWFRQFRTVRPSFQCVGTDALHRDLSRSLLSISLPQLLRYEDRNSMRHSIESRVPFCLPSMVDLAYSLPPEYLVSDEAKTKYVLREAMRGIVPDTIIDRRKVGFETPERAWVAAVAPIAARKLRGMDSRAVPFIHDPAGFIARICDDAESIPPYAWRIINIIAWMDLMKVSV